MRKLGIFLVTLLMGLASNAYAAVSVSPSGAATYSIPIEAPPGVNGMQPNLSLNYNSQGGNGILGMGWGLSGLSTIHRCPQTVAQDGQKKGISLTATDRFCLDGQRLAVVNGTYGAAGAEYRTEIDSFAKIISNGTAGTGPASFTVLTKDGKTMEYGVTADSRIEAQGKTEVLYWSLNRISDRQGNEVAFSYIEDNAAGHYRIDRIDYAGNSVMSIAPKASVRFVYESRTDNTTGHIAGSKYSTPVRMTNVQTYITNTQGDVMVRDYVLAYEYGTATGRSRLLTVIEHDANGNAKPATSFVWQNNSGWVSSAGLSEFGPAQGYTDNNNYPLITGDWNGDGRTDIGRVWSQGVSFYVSTGNGFVAYNGLSTFGSSQGYTNNSTHPLITGDWNGDGRTDIARVWSQGVTFYVSTGSGFAAYNGLSVFGAAQGYTNSSTHPILPADWNGDGRTDVARVWASGVSVQKSGTSDFAPDLLNTVTTPLGTTSTLTYKPLTDSTVYTKGTGAVYPELDIQAAMYVVSQASVDDGVGGQRVSTYKYGGMKADMSGRGNLGFAWMESTDTATGIVGRTEFSQTYPYVGRATHSERKLSNGTLIERVTNTWSNLYTTGSIYSPYLSSSTKESFEINDGTNNPIASVTTTRGYNSAFTPTTLPASYQETVTETFSDGQQKVAVSTMSNDMANWIIGQLSSATVTNSLPGGASASRTSAFTYYPVGSGKDALLQSEVIEPGATDPMLTLTTTYDYDGFGNRISSVVSGNTKDATGAVVAQSRTTSVTYDPYGQFPVSTTNAMNHSETYTWDARFGVKTSLTGPNALTTNWSYDGFGRKVGETRADGTSTTITYHMDTAPFYVTTQSTGSPAKTTYYDALGRKIQMQATGFSGASIYIDTEYNALGQVWRKSRPYATGGTLKWTSYTYDAIGRVTSETKPDTTVTSTAYNGLSTTVTNALSQTRTEIKDVRGKVKQVIDSMNGTLIYAYDPFGNLLTTTDNVSNVVSMSYDLRGRKIGMNDPDMGVWSYAYNAFGELISQTNARSQTTTMLYDALGRMTSRTEPDMNNNPVTSTWTYDVGTKAIGKLNAESAPGGYAKAFIYDPYGRPSSTTATINNTNYTMGTSYTTDGKIDTVTYPTGFAIKRIYNAQGYLSQVQNAANAAEVFWTADIVDEEGRVLQETLGNGISTVRQYNQQSDRLEAIVAGPNADGTIQNLGLTYDNVGNLSSRSDYVLNWTENFTYDALNRIRTVSGPANKTYDYDSIGNITNKSDVGAYVYGDANHVHAVTQAGGNNYTYDANGNMLTGAGRTISWTSFDRPASISTANAYDSMSYDANHKRITKNNTVTGEVTVYVSGAFEEVTQGGITKAKHYIRSGNGLVAIMEQVATVKLMKYVHNDQLGSINVITDNTGAVLERLSFDAFGNPRNPDATDPLTSIIAVQTTRGYTGHKMDAEVGLINMNARLYDPVLGRFISADVTIDAPQDMQTYNRYTYVMNNPFAHTDPSGNWSWKNFWKSAKVVIIAAVVIAAAVITYGYVLAAYANAAGVAAASSFVAAGGSTMSVGYLAAYGTAYAAASSSIIGGAIAGAAAGFVGGALGAVLNGGNLSEIWQSARSGMIVGAITGGVSGYYGGAGGDLSAKEILANGVAKGVASEATGEKFWDGFKSSLMTSGVRLLWQGTQRCTDHLKDKAENGSNNVLRNKWGEKLSDGARGYRTKQAPKDIFSIFGINGMAYENTPGMHNYDVNSFLGRFVNWTSKFHDVMNSWGYDTSTGFVADWTNSNMFIASGYEVWSFSGMLPAAAVTGIAHSSEFGGSDWAFKKY